MTGFALSPDAWQRVSEATRRVEGMPSGEQGAGPGARLIPGAAARVVLLQDLENGFPAWARVTAFSARPWWDIAIFGDASNATFKLRIDGQETQTIQPTATAAEFRAALSAAGATVAGVGLGYTCHPETGAWISPIIRHPLPGMGTPAISGRPFNPGRWLVALDDVETGLTVSSESTGIHVVIRPTNWIDAGASVQVYTAIPLSRPTPLTAGSVCLVERVSGVPVVTAAEPRYFESGLRTGGSNE